MELVKQEVLVKKELVFLIRDENFRNYSIQREWDKGKESKRKKIFEYIVV